MYILGISCYYHDSAAVLIHNGRIIAAAEEERFSRVKHDNSFPSLAINFCLQKAHVSINDITYVVFYEKPFLKFERILISSFLYAPKSFPVFKEAMKEWFFDKLWIKNKIIQTLQISKKKLLFCDHHLSHAASSFFCSPFNKSAVLSIDGVGEWATTSWGIGNGNTIEIKEELRFPHSLGLLYSVFTAFVGFSPNDGEYKLMGLAPYGKPIYTEKIKKLLSINNDGSFLLDVSYFSFHRSVTSYYTDKFVELFGHENKNPEELSTYYADIAASIQYVFEEVVLKITQYVKKKTNTDSLCFAGGVALNSCANWKIRNKSGFSTVFIQPAAGDAGGAMGAALWVYYSLCKNNRQTVLSHAYFGDSETEEEREKFLKKENIKYKKYKRSELIEKISDLLTKGKVIGLVDGEFEWGPRALGHRSIIADPRTHEMRDLVNKKIKFREAFRPFAPSVLFNYGKKYFEIGNSEFDTSFQFMLYVVAVKKKYKNQLQAVTHKDGTARPQLVTREVNSFYYDLIHAFGKKTGIYAVLNTSFNLRGEPIVNTSREAYNTFLKSEIDYLLLGNCLISKEK